MAYGYSYGPQKQIMSATEAQGRNTNSIMAGWIDRGPWQYYDTLQAAAGTAMASQYQAFSVQIGAQNPLANNTTKTKLQTNMQLSGQFPPPRCLLLLQLGFYMAAYTAGGVWTPMFLDDIEAILQNYYVEFKIDDKVFHEGPLALYPSGLGLGGATAQSGQAVWTNGLPAPGFSRRYGDWAKYIAPIQLFTCTIINQGTPPTLDANGPGMYMQVIADGLTDRSVQ